MIDSSKWLHIYFVGPYRLNMRNDVADGIFPQMASTRSPSHMCFGSVPGTCPPVSVLFSPPGYSEQSQLPWPTPTWFSRKSQCQLWAQPLNGQKAYVSCLLKPIPSCRRREATGTDPLAPDACVRYAILNIHLWTEASDDTSPTWHGMTTAGETQGEPSSWAQPPEGLEMEYQITVFSHQAMG